MKNWNFLNNALGGCKIEIFSNNALGGWKIEIFLKNALGGWKIEFFWIMRQEDEKSKIFRTIC